MKDHFFFSSYMEFRIYYFSMEEISLTLILNKAP